MFGRNSRIERLHYSIIVFDQADVESSRIYTLIYERVNFTRDGGSYEFHQNFTDNFIIGWTDFNSERTLVAVDFKTDFKTLDDGKYGLHMNPSRPRNR